MIEVKKIKEKIELKDMEVNDYHPCYYYWAQKKQSGKQDCSMDCTNCGTDKNGRKIQHCAYAVEEY